MNMPRPRLALDQPFVHQLLVAFQNRERIDPIFSSDIANRRQGIAFLEHSVEYHRDHAVAKLAVDRLTVIPLTVHQVFQKGPYQTLPEIPHTLILPVQIEVRAHRLIAWLHISPVLGVMVRVDDGERRMVHVAVLRAAGDVEKVEFHRLAIG